MYLSVDSTISRYHVINLWHTHMDTGESKYPHCVQIRNIIHFRYQTLIWQWRLKWRGNILIQSYTCMIVLHILFTKLLFPQPQKKKPRKKWILWRIHFFILIFFPLKWTMWWPPQDKTNHHLTKIRRGKPATCLPNYTHWCFKHGWINCP